MSTPRDATPSTCLYPEVIFFSCLVNNLFRVEAGGLRCSGFGCLFSLSLSLSLFFWAQFQECFKAIIRVSYSAVENGSAGMGAQTSSSSSDMKLCQADHHSRRLSQQSVRSSAPSACKVPSRRQFRQVKWWPWPSTKPKNSNANILIRISGDEDIHVQPQQTNLSQHHESTSV